MTTTNKIVTLWLLILIGYILHSQFYLAGLFYGIDIKLKDAPGKEPMLSHIMHLIFDVLPMVIIVLSLYLTCRAYRLVLLIVVALFLIANGAHLTETINEDAGNISQITLTGFIFVLNLLLAREAFKWLRESATAQLSKDVQ